MTWFDPERSEGARLDEDARAWLPTGDLRAHEAIVVLLARVAATGVDPIAALRDAMERWLGREAATALPPSVSAGSPHVGSDDDAITLEPLPPLRRPTMWPQRPKRLPGELFSSWLRRAAVAAGVAPYRFALEAIGRRLADPDRGVSDATLHRLALATGQSFENLAGGTLRPAPLPAARRVLAVQRRAPRSARPAHGFSAPELHRLRGRTRRRPRPRRARDGPAPAARLGPLPPTRRRRGRTQPVYLDRLALCLVTAERSVAARDSALMCFRSERQWAWIRPPPARDGASTPPTVAQARLATAGVEIA